LRRHTKFIQKLDKVGVSAVIEYDETRIDGKLASGQVYIYRVTWPERATLSINRGPDGNWRRSQLEKAGNHRAGPRTLQAVDEWLAAYRVGA